MDAAIIPARSCDLDALAQVWFRSARAAHPYLPQLQALTAETAQEVFRDHIAPGLELWVAREAGTPVGFVGLQGGLLDRLYVDPPAQRRGWGGRLLNLARARRPEGLRLFTHQQNAAARGFYEQHGFVIVRFGVSPPPESVPDVEYAWSPLGHRESGSGA
jgi:ribosomal protein S18 acetylase RimI-like enzyme